MTNYTKKNVFIASGTSNDALTLWDWLTGSAADIRAQQVRG